MSQPVPHASRTLKAILTLVCLAFFAGGCVAGVITYRAIAEAHASKQWPTARGKIVRSGVDVSVHRDRSRDRDRRREETRSYSAAIEYEFQVNEEVFHGTRIAVISDQFGSKGWAESTAKRFPVGSDVTVSFNPASPEQCVLEPGRWGGAGFLLILTILFGTFPPLVLRAIWSSTPVDTSLHPETRSQRILNGLEVRERVLTWEPGQLVHLQRDSISFVKVIGGAIVAGLVLGLLFGLAPALFFFAGRGPIFIGQFYLVASAAMAVITGVWLWLDNRPRETRIEWSTERIQLVVGGGIFDASFSQVQKLTVIAPQPKRASSPGHEPSIAVRVNMVVNEKAFTIVESECPAGALRHVRTKLTSAARELSISMNVPFEEVQ
ncbi:MAG: DUF3592 domain-containing protein [Planctomyces sp.]|nr:DUF3592 domain-containing protein [Planctomyces sp.]